MVEFAQERVIRGGAPNWTGVPAQECLRPPYVSICQVVGTNASGAQSLGSGWLAENGVVFTAAHLLFDVGFEAVSCHVLWPSVGHWQKADGFKIHPEFFEPNRHPKVGSKADIAKVWGFEQRPPSGLHMGAPSGEDVEVAGFWNGDLVRGRGRWKAVSAFVGHDADTLNGHSGAPLLSAGRAVGVHVAAASTSKGFLSQTDASKLDTMNCAVGLSPHAVGFSQT